MRREWSQLVSALDIALRNKDIPFEYSWRSSLGIRETTVKLFWQVMVEKTFHCWGDRDNREWWGLWWNQRPCPWGVRRGKQISLARESQPNVISCSFSGKTNKQTNQQNQKLILQMITCWPIHIFLIHGLNKSCPLARCSCGLQTAIERHLCFEKWFT